MKTFLNLFTKFNTRVLKQQIFQFVNKQIKAFFSNLFTNCNARMFFRKLFMFENVYFYSLKTHLLVDQQREEGISTKAGNF